MKRISNYGYKRTFDGDILFSVDLKSKKCKAETRAVTGREGTYMQVNDPVHTKRCQSLLSNADVFQYVSGNGNLCH